MLEKNKNKALGQYFSGEIVARMLSSLVYAERPSSVIDPMAGIGDLLVPYLDEDTVCHAIEIDPEAYSILNKTAKKAVCENAFSLNNLHYYLKKGYDLVITNPPYVRWQNQENASSFEHYLSIDEIISNLKVLLRGLNTFSAKEKDLFVQAIDGISGLADMAVPSWILCMMLTGQYGELAIVVPNSWMTREYAKPVIALLNHFFEIRYIVKDVNSALFKGKAQVKTDLVVARRKYTSVSENGRTIVVSLYSKFLYSSDSVERLRTIINSSNSLPEECEIESFSQRELFDDSRQDTCSLRVDSVLNDFIDLSVAGLTEIQGFGIRCYQGLRTGANKFFYYERSGDIMTSGYGDKVNFVKAHKYFLPAIQNQKDLEDTYSQNALRGHYLLYIQDSATEKDRQLGKTYSALPADIEKAIGDSEKRTVKGRSIPELSAVATNVQKGSDNKPARFWYMLPPLSERHRPRFFIPRLNAERTHVFYNPNNAIIDANFISITLDESTATPELAVLALLNSTWSSLLFEESCTPMGGGALKVDSIQVKGFVYPSLDKKDLKQLESLGALLANSSIGEENEVLNRIDAVVLRAAGIRYPLKARKVLRTILTKFIDRRNGRF